MPDMISTASYWRAWLCVPELGGYQPANLLPCALIGGADRLNGEITRVPESHGFVCDDGGGGGGCLARGYWAAGNTQPPDDTRMHHSPGSGKV